MEQNKRIFLSPGSRRTRLVPEATLSSPSGPAGSEATPQPSGQQAQETEDQETGGECSPGLVPNSDSRRGGLPGGRFSIRRGSFDTLVTMSPDRALSATRTQRRRHLHLAAGPKGTHGAIICRFMISRDERSPLGKAAWLHGWQIRRERSFPCTAHTSASATDQLLGLCKHV